jgi:hypothetical protein
MLRNVFEMATNSPNQSLEPTADRSDISLLDDFHPQNRSPARSRQRWLSFVSLGDSTPFEP